MVIEPANLAILGLAAPQFILGAGQMMADSVRGMANRTAAPFLDLLGSKSPGSVAVTGGDSRSSTDNSGQLDPHSFGQLYRNFEEQLRSFLASFPGLPSVRVQIDEGGRLRAMAADPAELTPEATRQIEQLTAALNDDFSLTDAADALQQAKARGTWRSGQPSTTATVEFLIRS